MHSNTKEAGGLPFLWMAPESIHIRTFSKYTESWSFGVFLWELFSPNQNPYEEFPDQRKTNSQILYSKLCNNEIMRKPDYAPEKV